MLQSLTIKVKLNPTKEQVAMLRDSSIAYINAVNELVYEMVVEWNTNLKKSSKDIIAPLNSTVRNQVVRDAKSIFAKVKKNNFEWIPFLKNPIIVWNNQNYTIDANSISMPFMIDGKSRKVSIKATFQAKDLALIERSVKVGTLRVSKKSNKWIGQIAIEVSHPESDSTKVMGIDLGLKCPAVCATDENEVKFCGNGRQNKYFRRYHSYRRRKLGQAKKLKAVKKSRNKEQRYMNDQDHKISREIVDFAVSKNIGIIKLENLSEIRKTTRTSRKNTRNLHSWSFYRLAMYIEYKASLVGITVEYVDPKYTSQRCPSCDTKNKAKDRMYTCKCGYVGHRDLIGAKNITKAPVLNGDSLAA